jgi:exonuclease III
LQSERTTERRTAIIGLELERYNIDIAALSETRFAGTGQLTEPTSGYTYLWSDLPESEKRLYGVGFAIKTSIVKELEKLPTAVNERLMWLRVKISEKRYATIISAYAPTMTNEEVVKEK